MNAIEFPSVALPDVYPYKYCAVAISFVYYGILLLCVTTDDL